MNNSSEFKYLDSNMNQHSSSFLLNSIKKDNSMKELNRGTNLNESGIKNKNIIILTPLSNKDDKDKWHNLFDNNGNRILSSNNNNHVSKIVNEDLFVDKKIDTIKLKNYDSMQMLNDYSYDFLNIVKDKNFVVQQNYKPIKNQIADISETNNLKNKQSPEKNKLKKISGSKLNHFIDK